MGDTADALIAIWDGGSSGTKHMINYALNLNRIKKIYVNKIIGEIEHANIRGDVTRWS